MVMKMAKQLSISVLITSTLFLSGSYARDETYNKFGFSFHYPEDQQLVEKGTPLYGKKPSYRAGNIWIGSDLKTKPLVLIAWFPARDEEDPKDIVKILDAAIRARKQDHDVYLGKILQSNQSGHKIYITRFITVGKEGYLLNVTCGYHCDVSKRIFHITSSAPWKNPTIVYGSNGAGPQWPDLNKDPSYIAYENLAKSFRCHQ